MNSIISFPERGPYGKSSYRGNCSGFVQKSLFEQFNSKIVTDPMAGSFTTRDVANEMKIKSFCYDLSSGFNALKDDIPDEARAADTWFWHPPYSSVINIPYAGSMWDDKAFEKKFGYDPKPYDLGRMNWDEFIKSLNKCLFKFYAAMDTSSRICILMGDIKKNGVCHSMIKDIATIGTLENIVIKAQHNCVSDGKSYANKNFIPIVHEYVMILKKLPVKVLDFSYSFQKKVSLDVRDSLDISWKELVYSVFLSLGKRNVCLKEIYEKIKDYQKAKNNANFEAKIRQILGQNPNLFKSVDRGIFSLAAS